MLTPLDDFLVHQTPETVDRVATSDRNFYDRYYFNAHTLDGSVFMVVAMGLYPNIGVIDAFVTVMLDGKAQHILRASRELGADRMHTKVGPIGVEVIEGLRRLRVYAEQNQHGITFDMTFEGTTPAYEEPHFFRRLGNRVSMDYTRLTQCGRWSGTLKAGGRTFHVEPGTWWGARDHSWGIRPVGGGEPQAAPPPGAGPSGFWWLWSTVQFPDAALLVTCSEDGDGSRWHTSAEVLYPESSGRAAERLTFISHEIELLPGTRTFRRGAVMLARPDGSTVKVRMEPRTTLYMSAVGYAYAGGWRHGQYHGPLVVEGETWDLTDASLLPKIAGQTETVCDYHVEGLGDLGIGHGITEFLLLGAYEPYGFRRWDETAKST
jgi:hypothetical protein